MMRMLRLIMQRIYHWGVEFIGNVLRKEGGEMAATAEESGERG